ncbi:MAG: hypothetical protein GWN99_16440 [Gemmatimonadetes bacterium]|uniref:Uncharacterized protein n=1 Tax=Candidatus Kutchimonas denitrificans TaxID=3056748 RepID=A0AAE4Z6B1_9BACT|nr:hypothetical protein [Gemmatimonadota bacterium]NIR74378.1 hypothetical protein [Candidatus Kutchimonas denitrificans]NIS02629.1 hypothetical protein [Gemmatimonadota bacterium]NIT68504.1 hypothetical protein [Gemmatimonadota bacterium]NIU51981.1 hypothetical protein [Gemmatimonadota bacterium]
MNAESAELYRVTIRHRSDGAAGYEVFEIEAPDIREALTRTAERFPGQVVESADLVEIRAANPA